MSRFSHKINDHHSTHQTFRWESSLDPACDAVSDTAGLSSGSWPAVLDSVPDEAGRVLLGSAVSSGVVWPGSWRFSSDATFVAEVGLIRADLRVKKYSLHTCTCIYKIQWHNKSSINEHDTLRDHKRLCSLWVAQISKSFSIGCSFSSHKILNCI